MGPASSFPDCPISHPRCVWWCPDTIWVLLCVFWACTDPLQAQNMHNTDPKKGFSFFFFPPLLGMLKNHQKATDIENFDENFLFLSPTRKGIKFHPFKIFFEGAYPSQVCPPETLFMVLFNTVANYVEICLGRLTIVTALQNWKNKHLVASVSRHHPFFGGQGEEKDESGLEQTRK